MQTRLHLPVFEYNQIYQELRIYQLVEQMFLYCMCTLGELMEIIGNYYHQFSLTGMNKPSLSTTL